MKKGWCLLAFYLLSLFILSVPLVFAQEVNCTDSDGGTDYYELGNITLTNGSSFLDYCVGDKLKEYICSGGTNVFGTATYDCSEEGMECVKGVCLKVEEDFTCTDSDGGLRFYVQGNTTEVNKTAVFDYCINDDNLTEYYCTSEYGVRKSHVHSCLKENKTCLNGICTIEIITNESQEETEEEEADEQEEEEETSEEEPEKDESKSIIIKILDWLKELFNL